MSGGRASSIFKTVFITLLVSLASGLSMIGLTETNTTGEYAAKYLAPSILLNIVVISYILYKISSKRDIKTGSIVLAFILVFGGYVLELALTLLYTDMPRELGTYLVVVLNYIIRMYYLFDLDMCSSIPLKHDKQSHTKHEPTKPQQLPDDIFKLLRDRAEALNKKGEIGRVKTELLKNASLRNKNKIDELLKSSK